MLSSATCPETAIFAASLLTVDQAATQPHHQSQRSGLGRDPSLAPQKTNTGRSRRSTGRGAGRRVGTTRKATRGKATQDPEAIRLTRKRENGKSDPDLQATTRSIRMIGMVISMTSTKKKADTRMIEIGIRKKNDMTTRKTGKTNTIGTTNIKTEMTNMVEMIGRSTKSLNTEKKRSLTVGRKIGGDKNHFKYYFFNIVYML
ncbi:unnamed protein product [Acanthoscelides obtectus]|uniref:Uncharacterized protein n=1 Tax=Acanthoscelides obtectus TaxID=200917 RepID=A0A9P0NUZ2_ACAOB|nr:unnamed protein product [Acanthoscelides obtectus]CAK1641377.1 hypothetical protein AOBTE_LOCUS12372 [Acanthoscelides obtectus]